MSHRAVRTSIEMQLDPGPIASRGVFPPVFLKEPIATCDFPGGGGGGSDILSLSGSGNDSLYICLSIGHITMIVYLLCVSLWVILRTSIKCFVLF